MVYSQRHGWSGGLKSTPCPTNSAYCTGSSAHLVLVGVVSLHTSSLEAELALTTAGAICPGKVAGLAHHLALGLAGTPQLGAVLHVRTGLRAHAKGQLTLLAQGVAGTRQVFGQGDRLAGLVQEAVAYKKRRAFIKLSNARISEPKIKPAGRE